MGNVLEKLIVLGLIVLAAVCAWSVLTPNHFFLG